MAHPTARAALAVGRYGTHIATGSADGTVRIWDCVDCGPFPRALRLGRRRVVRPLSADERATYLHQ